MDFNIQQGPLLCYCFSYVLIKYVRTLPSLLVWSLSERSQAAMNEEPDNFVFWSAALRLCRRASRIARHIMVRMRTPSVRSAPG
jgi:hypothetical protein